MCPNKSNRHLYLYPHRGYVNGLADQNFRPTHRNVEEDERGENEIEKGEEVDEVFPVSQQTTSVDDPFQPHDRVGEAVFGDFN